MTAMHMLLLYKVEDCWIHVSAHVPSDVTANTETGLRTAAHRTLGPDERRL